MTGAQCKECLVFNGHTRHCSARVEQLTAENEMRRADYIKLCKKFDDLTAERDALLAEKADEKWVAPLSDWVKIRADNDRLRAQLSATENLLRDERKRSEQLQTDMAEILASK